MKSIKQPLTLNRSADLLIGSVPNLMRNEPIWRSALRRVQGFTARTSVRRILTLTALAAWLPLQLHAQSTAFTYQGRLESSGTPANGSYDLRFAIYDAAGGGGMVGGALTNATTGVTNGLFTTTLDFGPGIFTGANRWLEIAVRTNGTASFVTLTPRQAVTPTPYAMQAASLAANGLPAGTYTSAVTFNNPASTYAGVFTGNGAGLTNLPSGGVTNNQVLPGNVSSGGTISAVGGFVGLTTSLTNASGQSFGTAAFTAATAYDAAGRANAVGASLTNALTRIGNVNNIKNFLPTAGSGDWVVDTAAFQAALNCSRLTNGYPVYIPAGDYLISNIILNAENNWNVNDSIGGYNSGTRIFGDYGRTRLHQVDINTPIITITNGLNHIILEKLSFNGLGKAVGAQPLLVISGITGSTDGFKAQECFFQSSWIPLDARAFSSSHFDHCFIAKNNCAGVFRGDGGESDNNLFFLGGAVAENNNGFNMTGANVCFDHVEMGGPMTNMVLCTASSVTITMIGGNCELGYGAFVTVSNNANVNLSILGGARLVKMSGSTRNPYLVDFQDTGTWGSSVIVGGGASVGLNVRVGLNRSSGNNPTVLDYNAGSSLAVEFNGRYTNYATTFPLSEGAFGWDANSYPNRGFGRITTIRSANMATPDSSGYSSHILGVRSNSTYYGIDLAQYWKDGILNAFIRAGISNRFAPGQFVYAGNSAGLNTTLTLSGGNNGVDSGPRIRFVMGNGTTSLGTISAIRPSSGVQSYGSVISLSPNNDLGPAGVETNAFEVRWDGTAHASRGFVADGGFFSMPTNYVAANFIPVSGMVKLVASNNWMFSVTPWATNAAWQIQP